MRIAKLLKITATLGNIPVCVLALFHVNNILHIRLRSIHVHSDWRVQYHLLCAPGLYNCNDATTSFEYHMVSKIAKNGIFFGAGESTF